MRRTFRAALLPTALALAVTGCAGKKPLSVRWIGCRVVNTWTDPQGQGRNDFDCRNCKQVGIDAKTRAVIMRCK